MQNCFQINNFAIPHTCKGFTYYQRAHCVVKLSGRLLQTIYAKFLLLLAGRVVETPAMSARDFIHCPRYLNRFFLPQMFVLFLVVGARAWLLGWKHDSPRYRHLNLLQTHKDITTTMKNSLFFPIRF